MIQKEDLAYLEKALLSQDIDNDLNQNKYYHDDCLFDHHILNKEFKNCYFEDCQFQDISFENCFLFMSHLKTVISQISKSTHLY